MKIFKKHPKESIILTVFLVIIITSVITFLVMWFGGNGDKYGSRLDGIKEVQLSNAYLLEISDKVKEEGIVSEVRIDLRGKLINAFIKVNDDTPRKDSEKLSKIIIDNMTEDELKFYDIQVFILDSKDGEESAYPIIGYKHKTSDVFVWSNE